MAKQAVKKGMKGMKRIYKYLKMRFCRHDMRQVKDSPHWFHEKCNKCGYEKGLKL